MDFSAFGEQVRARRVEEGLTQDELADKVGVSRVYLSLIERGRAQNLSWTIVSSLSKVLGIGSGFPAEGDVSDSLTAEEQERLPQSLKDFIAHHNTTVPIQDQRMLLNLRYRGNQPSTEDEWRLLYTMIKAIVGKDRE